MQIKTNVKAIFTGCCFLQKCVTEEIHNDDDEVETTGLGAAGASAAASPLFSVHGAQLWGSSCSRFFGSITMQKYNIKM